MTDLFQEPNEDLMQHFDVHAGEIYACETIFFLRGTNPKTLDVRRSQHNKGQPHYAYIKRKVEGELEARFYYKLKSVPESTRTQLNFPDPKWIAAHFSRQVQMKAAGEEEKPQPESIQKAEMSLREALKKHEFHRGLFYDENALEPTIIMLCQKYCVLHQMIMLEAVRSIQINDLFLISCNPEFKSLGFPTVLKTFYGYFDRAKEAAKLGNFALVQFVKGRYGVPSNARKVNGDVVDLLIVAASHPNNVSNRLIMIWLNTMLIAFPKLNGGKIIGLTRVDELVNENWTEIKAAQEGEAYIRKVITAYQHVVQAERPLD